MNRAATRGTMIVAALAGLSACGAAPSSTTTNVSVEPTRACNLVEQRRDLGANPPELGFTVQQSDVDNFAGETELECNERSLVYWGPSPAVGGQRSALLVRFSFAENAEEAEASARRSAPPGPAIGIADGDAKLELFPGDDGTYAARFVSGGAVVNVTAGCVSRAVERGSELDLTPVACSDPPLAEDIIRQRAIEAATELERQLRGKLD